MQPSVSGYIQGSVNIVSPSSFTVDGEIFYPLYIIGNVTGTNLITFGSEKETAFEPFPLDIQGTATPPVGIAPAITSANSTTFTVGTAGSFTVTATGFPTPSLSESPPPPSGVTFVDNHNGTATLAGTPAAGSAGIYPLTITAANGVAPNATQSFTLSVADVPTVTHLGPNNGPAAGGTSVTITGTNFAGATVVDFGTTAATDLHVVNNTTITATSPAGTGIVDVTVTTPGGKSTTSTNDRFTYT